MKKNLIILLVMIIFIMLFACEKNSQALDNNNDLSKIDISNKYDEAKKVYSWFDIGTLDVDMNDQVVVDDVTYFRVNDEVTEYEDLVNRLESIFDDAIVQKLLSSPLYINVNGQLYGVVADRGTDIRVGEESHQIKRRNDEEIIYEVSVDLLGPKGKVEGSKTYNFLLKLYGDDKWRFKEFFMVR